MTHDQTLPASTGWAEQVDPAEAERHAAFSEVITSIQTKVNAKRGPRRAFHRKQVAGLRGTLTIPTNPPEPARQGLCGTPGTYQTLIRLSNGAISPGPA